MRALNKLFLLSFVFICCSSSRAASLRNKSFWYDRNYELIRQRMASVSPEQLMRVKNVVLFVGDGMGLTTITASRVLKRQTLNSPEEKLTFDDFPATALIQTENADSLISDSAAAATALFCGVKTNSDNLGLDETTSDCVNVDSHVPSLFSWAQKQNLKTG